MSLAGFKNIGYAAAVIAVITTVSGCAGTRTYNYSVSLTVNSHPPSATISYKDGSAGHGQAPALIHYAWDPKFVSGGCLRTKGLTATWRDGSTKSTEDIVTLCNPGRNHEITLNKGGYPRAGSSRGYTICPDGTRVKGSKCFKMFDGTYEGE